MGWTYTWGATRRDIIKELTSGWENDLAKYEVLAHCCVGNILWTVGCNTVKTTGKQVKFIGCNIMAKSRDGWGYKDMDESMGPHYYSCPLSYLDMAPQELGDTSYAGQWRERVREHWARARAAAEGIKGLDMAVGATFESSATGKVFTFVRRSRGSVVGRDVSGRQWRVKNENVRAFRPAGSY